MGTIKGRVQLDAVTITVTMRDDGGRVSVFASILDSAGQNPAAFVGEAPTPREAWDAVSSYVTERLVGGVP